jgi:gluconolactonase
MRKSYISVIIMLILILVILPELSSQSPVPEGNEAVEVADGFQFVEGPVWVEGTGLLFSDIPANIVYRWTEDDGASEYINPSGNSNGLALDNEGRLLLAQHGNRQIARREESGNIVPLATHYDGMRLNSPNDMAVKSDGSVFFTDPPYGLNNPATESETGFSGIYRLSPEGNVQLLDSTLYRPNGIAFSPDEFKLYVNDSEARIIYVWDVVDDTTIVNKQVFASMSPAGNADGMKVDDEGNVFSSGPIGIWVFSPDGTTLDTIPVPGQTTNCGWGPEKKSLYITSGNAVYVISMEPPASASAYNVPDNILGNYPNPFSSQTNISFSLDESKHVLLDVYDSQGKNIERLIDDEYASGNYQFNWSPENLTSGMYYIRFSTEEYSVTNKCFFLR